MISRPFFTPRGKRACVRTWTMWLAAIFLGETFLASFDYWPLAVSMPPTKVCPQCKAAVPVRRKTCERCDHVFRSKRKAECNLREISYHTYELPCAFCFVPAYAQFAQRFQTLSCLPCAFCIAPAYAKFTHKLLTLFHRP